MAEGTDRRLHKRAEDPTPVTHQRETDRGRRARLRVWWRENGVQVVVFALLGVIVAGELSDFVNDRAQERRDSYQACVIGNLSEQSAESVRRLRIQAPIIDAAGTLITGTVEQRRQAEEELRLALQDREDELDNVEDLPKPEDCPAP